MRITLLILFLSLLHMQSGQSNSLKFSEESRSMNDLGFSVYKNVKQQKIITTTINPDNFIVGPGDIFLVDFVSSAIVSQFELIISVTGELIIPMVGTTNVNKKSLSEAIDLIEQSFKQQYNDAQLSIILKNAGNYNMYVKTPSRLNGEYSVNSLMRISDLFETILKDIVKNKKYDISSISKRKIKINNKDNSYYCDLEKFYATGDYSNNPYINREDEIEFGLIENSIEIWGGVSKPGKYELLKNESLEDIINLSGGFLNTAILDTLVITRGLDNDRVHLEIDFKTNKDFAIYHNDIINVKNQNRKLFKEVASISGEVLYPGSYSIDNSVTSIKELIDLAGGFTEVANKDIVIIENNFHNKLNISSIINKPKEYITESDLSFVEIGSTHYLNNRNIINRNEYSDYKLINGDKINVVQKINFIEIIGAVNRPGKYPYHEDYTVNDYITLAGGKKKNALRKSYIIEQGSVIKNSTKANQLLNGGDVIFIPYDLEINRWTRFKDWMAVSGQIAAFIVLIQNIIDG